VTESHLQASAAHVLGRGFVHLEGPFADPSHARAAAGRIARVAELGSPLAAGMPALASVGEFVIPPEGAPTRDFQVLHFDFGLPIDCSGALDVARYTALHIPLGRAAASARTRIAQLAPLLGQRKWPPTDVVTERLVEYGTRGGTRTGDGRYVEGILARLVEAADDSEASLPSACDCLCGEELTTLAEEREHFATRGVPLEEAEVWVDLQPGELLVLDNLATAHGRVGRRRPRELSQWMLGHSRLAAELQAELRDRVLEAFAPRQ
jgi:hypothetical protein